VTFTTDDNATLRAALGEAEIAPLVPAVAQLTGDYTLVREDLRPDPLLVLEPEGGLTEDQLSEIRELLHNALTTWREAGAPPAPDPTDEQLHQLMAYLITDETLVDEYFPVLTEELAIGGQDLRAPRWHKDEIAPDTDFTVAIVGAGMSGLLAAHRLNQAGVPFVIFDKNADVGGTWFENSYPGCRVDVANHLYSYSFSNHGWPQHFSDQATLLDFYRQFADEAGLKSHIRFETEVTSAEFDEDAQTWRVHTTNSDGAQDTHTFQAVISAVGQLNRPHFPEIPGRDDFAGPAFHSARWDHDIDLHGKRVAVIGNGASAAQLIPIVAEQAAHLTIFQRTANWLFDTPEYHDDLLAGHAQLLHDIPSYAQWSRLWLFWRTHEGLLPAARVDPNWTGPPEVSVSEMNEMVRELLTEYLTTQFADHPDLLAKVIPDYPPIAKRILRDNGIWVRTLTRDNVDLVTEPIERITQTGIETADGQDHPVDVIVYGTGFHASKFLTPMRVLGRGGADLHERWSGDARAYLGVTVPDFPNLFCLYGPNTNIVINGSIIYFSECGTDYIVACIRELLAKGHQTLALRQDVHDAFNVSVDAENGQMAWGVSSVHSWYKNANGRVAQNWPFSMLEYWRRTRAPDAADYDWR
jgi:4-hydroxyacetophenone monooxygenase